MNFDAKARQEAFFKTCELVKDRIEQILFGDRANKHRKQPLFKEGDLVWLNLRKERFPEQRKDYRRLKEGEFEFSWTHI